MIHKSVIRWIQAQLTENSEDAASPFGKEWYEDAIGGAFFILASDQTDMICRVGSDVSGLRSDKIPRSSPAFLLCCDNPRNQYTQAERDPLLGCVSHLASIKSLQYSGVMLIKQDMIPSNLLQRD